MIFYRFFSAIIADFDKLPSEEPGAVNAPLVQQKRVKNVDKKEYQTVAFRTYLVPKGSCDIFFATDFIQMQQIYKQLVNTTNSGGSIILKQSQFMEQFCEQVKQVETKSGYNPLLEDYKNMSFFLS